MTYPSTADSAGCRTWQIPVVTPAGRVTHLTTRDVAHALQHLPSGWRAFPPLEETNHDEQQRPAGER